MNSAPINIQLKKKSGILVLAYKDGSAYELSAELLRVYSPSAEVRGHGKGQAVLQSGKRHVKFVDLELTGNYAVRLSFDDGHDSGIYSWDYLRELGEQQDKLWQEYLTKLQVAGASREPDTQVIKIRN